jgi:transcriptional antiterminator
MVNFYLVKVMKVTNPALFQYNLIYIISYVEFIQISTYIEQLGSLLRKESTGTADEFAKKIGVSRRTLQNYLQQLKDIEVPIDYDHYKRTYKYTNK